MSDLIFMPDSIDSATLTVTSAATGYAKEKLQDRLTFTSWRSTTNANQNIDIDFGVATTCDHLVLLHNLVNNTYVDVFYASAANYSDALSVTDGVPAVVSGAGTLYLPFPSSGSYSARYWRVQITNIGGGQIAEAYLLFLGQRKTITIRYDYGNKMGPRSSSVIRQSLGGYRTGLNLEANRRVWSLPWEYMSKANYDNLVSVLSDTQGMAYPIFMQDPYNGTIYYVRIMHNELPAVESAHELYNLGPLIIEQEF